MKVFTSNGVRPAVRKVSADFVASVGAGDVLTFETVLTHHGKTSFTLHQTARRVPDRMLVAEGDFVLVAVDKQDKPLPVPQEIARFFGRRPSLRPGETQHVAVRGAALAVDIQGDGPAMLFIHGFPLDRTIWRHLMATLTGLRRIAPDLRGMGLSDLPEPGFGMPGFADDLSELLGVVGVKQVVVCGLSMGGYVAFELMRRHPELVRALVLVNTRADADDDQAKARRDEMIQTVERDGTDVLADLMVPKLLAPGTLTTMPRVVEHLRAMISGNPPAGLAAALAAMRDRPDSTELLANIAIPTLVVAGSDDQLIPAKNAKAMANAIPGAQFTLIPQAGHLAPLEQPIALSRVIGEFLELLS
jgi:pimeloyl-ACP methyl ester carboxylesterase